MNRIGISIVVPVFNSVNTIKRCIDSILIQDNIDLECIVVDCLSTDGSSEILANYGNKIRHIREKDSGIPDAMNKGIKLANSTLVGVLDADDFYYESTLKLIVDYHAKNSDKIICCSMFIKGPSISYKHIPVNIADLEIGMVINHTATFCPKSIFENIGFYSTKLSYVADWEFYRRAYRLNYEFKILDFTTTEYSLGGATHRHSKAVNQEMINVLSQNKEKSKRIRYVIFKRKFLYYYLSNILTSMSHKRNNFLFKRGQK